MVLERRGMRRKSNNHSRAAVGVFLILTALPISVCRPADSAGTPSAGAPPAPTAFERTATSTRTLPIPTGLKLRTFINGMPSALSWPEYPDPVAGFELEWRFEDVVLWQNLGEAAQGSREFGGLPLDLAFQGNFATYCYRIRAVDGSAASAWSEELCARIRAGEPYEMLRWAPPLEAPTVAADGSSGTAISWRGIDRSFLGTASFEVWRRDRSSPNYETVFALPLDQTKYFDQAGAESSCYRIRVVVAGGVPSLSRESCVSQ